MSSVTHPKCAVFHGLVYLRGTQVPVEKYAGHLLYDQSSRVFVEGNTLDIGSTFVLRKMIAPERAPPTPSASAPDLRAPTMERKGTSLGSIDNLGGLRQPAPDRTRSKSAQHESGFFGSLIRKKKSDRVSLFRSGKIAEEPLQQQHDGSDNTIAQRSSDAVAPAVPLAVVTQSKSADELAVSRAENSLMQKSKTLKEADSDSDDDDELDFNALMTGKKKQKEVSLKDFLSELERVEPATSKPGTIRKKNFVQLGSLIKDVEQEAATEKASDKFTPSGTQAQLHIMGKTVTATRVPLLAPLESNVTIEGIDRVLQCRSYNLFVYTLDYSGNKNFVFSVPLHDAIAIADPADDNAFVVVHSSGKLTVHMAEGGDKILWMATINTASANVARALSMNGIDRSSPPKSHRFWSTYEKELSNLMDSFDATTGAAGPTFIGIEVIDSQHSLHVSESQLELASASSIKAESTKSLGIAREQSTLTVPRHAHTREASMSSIATFDTMATTHRVGAPKTGEGALLEEDQSSEKLAWSDLDVSSTTATQTKDAPRALAKSENSLVSALHLEKGVMRQKTVKDGKSTLRYRKKADGSEDASSIVAGKFEKVVERLTDFEKEPDAALADAVLMGYRSFISAKELLRIFKARLNVVAAESSKEQTGYVRKWRPIVRLRTIALVKKWIEAYFFDFADREARQDLNDFITTIGQIVVDEPEDMSHEIQFILDFHRVSLRFAEYTSRAARNYSPPSASLPLAPTASKITFLDLDPKEVAYQLTVQDFNRFKAIRPVEFLLNVWNQSPGEAANLAEMTAAFNKISFWVATEICTQPELKKRTKVVENFVKIARKCRKLNNFNTLMAIISGFNTAAVSRLKQTWESIQPKCQATVKELEALVSPNNNYKNYRTVFDEMVSAKTASPFIPFVGLFCKDLYFTNDGNAKYVDEDLVNVEKLRTLHQKVTQFCAFQRVAFLFPTTARTETTREYLVQMRALKENALYKYSKLCEAKSGDAERLVDKWAAESKK